MTTDAYPGSAGERAGLLARVGRVFSFDTTVYEEVAAAPATLQALLVAAVAWTLSGSLVTIVLFFVMIPVGLAAVLAIVEFRADDAHEVHYVRRPFQREPDFKAASVNYTLQELLASAEEPR